jgi:hypothetical protein
MFGRVGAPVADGIITAWALAVRFGNVAAPVADGAEAAGRTITTADAHWSSYVPGIVRAVVSSSVVVKVLSVATPR